MNAMRFLGFSIFYFVLSTFAFPQGSLAPPGAPAPTMKTLDLNGFTISSTASPAAGSGVLLGSSVQNITILNGHISGSVAYVGSGGDQYTGPGFLNGIAYTGSSPLNVQVSHLTVSGCDQK